LWTPRIWSGFARHYDSDVSFNDWDEVAGLKTAQEAAESVRVALERDPNALLERAIYAFMGYGEVFFRRANGDWARLEELIREFNRRYSSTGANNKLQANHGIQLATGAAFFASTGRASEMEEWLRAARTNLQASVESVPPGSSERIVRAAAYENFLRCAAVERLDFAAVRDDAAATLAKLADLPDARAFSHKEDGGDPHAVAYFHSGQAAFFLGDYTAAANALNAAVSALNKWWGERTVVPGVKQSRQDRADAVEIELYRSHALTRAGRREEARAAFALAMREVETLHNFRPDLFITQRLLAHALWVSTDINIESSADEKRISLERARNIYRDADREKRLTRIEREIFLLDIDQQLAASTAKAAP
jgi:tetratricopeptide (TPR) repeat protein